MSEHVKKRETLRSIRGRREQEAYEKRLADSGVTGEPYARAGERRANIGAAYPKDNQAGDVKGYAMQGYTRKKPLSDEEKEARDARVGARVQARAQDYAYVLRRRDDVVLQLGDAISVAYLAVDDFARRYKLPSARSRHYAQFLAGFSAGLSGPIPPDQRDLTVGLASGYRRDPSDALPPSQGTSALPAQRVCGCCGHDNPLDLETDTQDDGTPFYACIDRAACRARIPAYRKVRG